VREGRRSEGGWRSEGGMERGREEYMRAQE